MSEQPASPDRPAERIAEGSPEHRAAVVAGIRALADFIENNPDLPVPQSITAQHSLLFGPFDDQLVIINAAAEITGESVRRWTDDEVGDSASVRKTLATNDLYAPHFHIVYTVHGSER